MLVVLKLIELILFTVYMAVLILSLCGSVLIVLYLPLEIIFQRTNAFDSGKNSSERGTIICFFLSLFAIILFMLTIKAETSMIKPTYYRTSDTITVNALYNKTVSYNYKDVKTYTLCDDKYSRYTGKPNLSVELQMNNGEIIQFAISRHDVENFAEVLESPSSLVEYSDKKIPDIYNRLNTRLFGSRFKYSYIILGIFSFSSVGYFYLAFCDKEYIV